MKNKSEIIEFDQYTDLINTMFISKGQKAQAKANRNCWVPEDLIGVISKKNK